MEVRQMGIEESHELRNHDEKKYIEANGQIIFTTPSRAIVNMLTRMHITFDVLVVEEASGINELETWWMGLPLVVPSFVIFLNKIISGFSCATVWQSRWKCTASCITRGTQTWP